MRGVNRSGDARRRDARAAFLRELLTESGAATSRQIELFDWASRVPEPKTGTLDFERFPFQRELYEQGTHEREAVIMKSTQVGVSAWASRWAMYHSDVWGRTGVYVFPTQRDVLDFSTARIKPLLDVSAYLRRHQRPTDPSNKGLIGLGGGLVYFRGSQSRRASTRSVPTTWSSTSTTCSRRRTSRTPNGA